MNDDLNNIVETTEENIENINVDGIIEPNENFVAEDVKEEEYGLDQTPSDIDETSITPNTVKEVAEAVEESNKILEIEDEDEKEKLATEMLNKIYKGDLTLESFTKPSLALEGLIDSIKRAFSGGMNNIENVLEVYESENIDIANFSLETQEVFALIYRYKNLKDLLLNLTRIYFIGGFIADKKIPDPKKSCKDAINTLRAYFDNNAKGVFYKTANLYKYSVNINKLEVSDELLEELKDKFKTINPDFIQDEVNGTNILKPIDCKNNSCIKLNLNRYKILKEFIKDVKEFVKEATVVEVNFEHLDKNTKELVYILSSCCPNIAAGLGKLVKEYNSYN